MTLLGIIKQYDSTVSVEIGAIVVSTAKKATSKNHPKDILCNEDHLYWIILVHLASNITFITRKHIQAAGYWIKKKTAKTQNFVCLTDHSRKARDQTKQRTATILWHKNKLTGGMCHLGFR